MPPKKRPPMPVDRPLSKAYLRQFSGWSTAYPPGLSEPNSIRVMENVMVTRDGAARVRPGLRSVLLKEYQEDFVGAHEVFYTAEGERAYLVAVRENDRVAFRVITWDDDGDPVLQSLTEAGFTFPYGEENVSFSLDCTYVRYLQIDNKIFALSNSPEPMVMFWVGTEKKAKRLAEITRPDWTAADKLTIYEPIGTWINNSTPTEKRLNLAYNPSFEKSTSGWKSGTGLTLRNHSQASSQGDRSSSMWSAPERTNYVPNPLVDASAHGTAYWMANYKATVSTNTQSLRITGEARNIDTIAWACTHSYTVTPGLRMRAAFDLAYGHRVRAWYIGVYFVKSNGEAIAPVQLVGGTFSVGVGRKTSNEFTVPSQAAYMRVYIGHKPDNSNAYPSIMDVNDVFCGPAPETSDAVALHGDMGTDYFWEGAAHASRSVYHPPQDISMVLPNMAVNVGGLYYGTADVLGPTGKTLQVQPYITNTSSTTIAFTSTTGVGDGSWNRLESEGMSAPAGSHRLHVKIIGRSIARGEVVWVDGVVVEQALAPGAYFDGGFTSTTTKKYRWTGNAHASASWEDTYDPQGTQIPTPLTPTALTLVNSDKSKNVYNFAFFYTFSNEIGESAPSQVTIVRVQRPWTQWLWETSNAAGEPTGTETDDPELCADQLVAWMKEEVFNAAIASGATSWNLYVSTWGPNDVPPVTALKAAEVTLGPDSEWQVKGHARITPQLTKIGEFDPLMPSEASRYNSTDPSRGSQGIVASDRLVLVGDPDDQARISWSSGQIGEFYNFSPALGGGAKQLTSGNLYPTACVKLWQNPQSVDTLTVLNRGDDGRSNAFYMQPATITSLSETVNVMGFEETTGMEGTTAPYGCEVVNNGLYHPLSHGLVKSTANNYNLSHKLMTEDIENMWRILQDQHHMVSASLDMRIYYLVHNRLGAPLEAGCWGNEIWMLDVAAKNPTWSRWLVQGISLRTMDFNGKVMMSVVKPGGIYVFDPDRSNDEWFDTHGNRELHNIPWYFETNTQGANRAHDAWANLQQANITMGNFLGQMRYGVVGQDVNGQHHTIEKTLVATAPPSDGVVENDSDPQDMMLPTLSPTDRDDYLLVRKVMKEWRFFAGSVNDEVDEVITPRYSGGQVNFVQYRYTPVTVNVGYEYGSVETFEYGSSAEADTTTDSGVPKPYVDLSLP